jgi:hypothetical protein
VQLLVELIVSVKDVYWTTEHPELIEQNCGYDQQAS